MVSRQYIASAREAEVIDESLRNSCSKVVAKVGRDMVLWDAGSMRPGKRMLLFQRPSHRVKAFRTVVEKEQGPDVQHVTMSIELTINPG